MTAPAVTLRPARASDEPFLLALRRRSMTVHLERSGEPTDEASHLWRLRYRFADAQIVSHDELPIGLLKVQREPAEWRLVQVQLLPDWQGRGIGGDLVGALLDQAAQARCPVRLGVLQGNPARRLYERLGFRLAAEDVREAILFWQPDLPAA